MSTVYNGHILSCFKSYRVASNKTFLFVSSDTLILKHYLVCGTFHSLIRIIKFIYDYCLVWLSIATGFAQTPPSQCVENRRIETDRMDLYITPGVVNCFSCALDATGNVNWQVALDGDLVVVTLSPDAVAVGNFLVIAMPDSYVQPGTSGRQNIVCSLADDETQTLEARLASPSKADCCNNYFKRTSFYETFLGIFCVKYTRLTMVTVNL